MGTLTIAQVAERVGYMSELAFSKAFRRLIGMRPGAYARRHMKSPGAASAPQAPAAARP